MSIEGVIFEHRGIAHKDPRRTLSSVFNSDFGDFIPRQVKVINEVPADTELGGHYHSYRELHYVLAGEAWFDLQDRETKESETYVLTPRDALLIPNFVAHKACVKRGTILISCTESAYISPQLNDHKYEF